MTEVSTVLESTANISQEPVEPTDQGLIPSAQPDPVVPRIKPVRMDHLTRFTPERSRLLQEKAQAARLAKKQARLAQGANPTPVQAVTPDKSPVNPDAGYVMDRLSRVRAHIDRVEAMVQEELDPQKLDRLTSALSRLSDIEQKLAGRPSPGSLRPTDKPSQGRASLLLGSSGPGPSRGKVEQE